MRGWVNCWGDEGGGVALGELSRGCGEEDLGGASGSSASVTSSKYDAQPHSHTAGLGSGRGFVTKYLSSDQRPLCEGHAESWQKAWIARTSEVNTIPEPFLPNQLDVSLTRFIELLSIFHFLRLFVTRAQQVSNLDRTLDVLDKYPLVMSNKSIYLPLPVWVINTRKRNHELREYGESIGCDALK